LALSDQGGVWERVCAPAGGGKLRASSYAMERKRGQTAVVQGEWVRGLGRPRCPPLNDAIEKVFS